MRVSALVMAEGDSKLNVQHAYLNNVHEAAYERPLRAHLWGQALKLKTYCFFSYPKQ